MSRRVEVGGGDWVELVDRLNHAQLRRVKRASSGGDSVEIETEAVAALATSWLVHDVDGREVPYPGGTAEGVPAAALDTWPADTVIEAFSAAAEIIAGVRDPKGSAGRSPSSPPAEPS